MAVAAGIPATDFYVNGTGAAYGLGFESFTSYLPVSSGAAALSVHRGGSGHAFIAADDTLAAGQQYTVLLENKGGAVQERLYTDQAEPAPAGQVSLRVVNAIEGASPVFYLLPAGAADNAPPLASFSLQSGEASAYLALPAGTYVVSATLPGGTLRIPVADITLKAKSGAVRTIVFAGTVPIPMHKEKSVVSFVLADADPA